MRWNTTMHLSAKACQKEDRRCLKMRNIALLSSWIWIHWGQEVLIPEVQFWDDNRKCHMSPVVGGLSLPPPHPEMGNGIWWLPSEGSLHMPFAEQTNHPTTHLLTGQNLRYYQVLLKLIQPCLPYVCVLVGQNTSPGCTSTEDLWSQQWRSQECCPLSHQPQVAGQESAIMCWQQGMRSCRTAETKSNLQKASVVRVSHAE